ncbi:MAG TPA: biotin--[acetyl-CoA-carboxylase] ligase [Xanthobacteraceae bacterium]|nr:biotin--[acetyl-CoA-carboxylase] ligase [Xanthobacteraceae bacterium]
MRLDPAAAAAGFRLLAHDTLPSTNTEALALARRGETEPLWVTARQQTAGRGRRGNAWISVPGNFYATLLLCDPVASENAPELSFVAALAVHDAIVDRAAALREKLALKWPNDVLCGSAKLAGILIESESVEAKLAVAIGIGVNCMHHPADTAYPATDLATVGAAVSAEDLFFALSGAMARRLAQWQQGAGFQSIRADWLDRAAGIGGEMRVRLPKNREFVGRAEALDERGRLLLRLADGTLQTITAGDVFPVAANGQN